MSARHHTPAYRRNARIVRKGVQALHRLGTSATCWRGGGDIPPGMPFDVGHRDPDGGDHVSNLAPEHRTRMPGCCRGNRNEGGATGARLTNSRPTPRRSSEVTTWKL